jgi:DNA-binding transcriptional ArsR family regulator
MTELTRLDETLLNAEMVNVARLQFKSEFATLQKSKEYPAQIARTWSYNDESYFEELGDSVYAVTMPHLRNFIVEYMNQRPPVIGLLISKADREKMQVDTAFTDLDESVAKYVFRYRENVTDLEGDENKMMLRNLLQWLKINNDVIAQINGFSDEHEYNRATDDTIMHFMDSIPTFSRITRAIIKTGYLKPEMMRAMKIIKYLYDHGITEDRLTGTSMMFKSANKQEEIDNMKCTLTLNKYHKSPSVYEYHYGKKKSNE